VISPMRPEIPFITSEAMREVDRLMTAELGVDLLQMMEGAGRALASTCRSRFMSGDVLGKSVALLCGGGANGGGALACARLLHVWGARVQVFLTKPRVSQTGVNAHQLASLSRMGVAIDEVGLPTADPDARVIIDGLIGYGLRGTPGGRTADLIRAANALDAPILALDVPTGVDATSGTVHAPAVKATATLTLALPKTGLRVPDARPFVGELYLADIGIPAEIYGRPSVGIQVPPLFTKADIVRVW